MTSVKKTFEKGNSVDFSLVYVYYHALSVCRILGDHLYNYIKLYKLNVVLNETDANLISKAETISLY